VEREVERLREECAQLETQLNDAINNGALDNAAGTSTMLEAARGFAQSGVKSKRTVVFVALTAEEKGLTGSDYFAHNPPTSGTIVADVNLDMPILLYDFTDIIAFGAERSTLGPIVKAAAGKMKSGQRRAPTRVKTIIALDSAPYAKP
jgi:Zn-dependent M28 family amino/carboxypeptidase